MSKLAVEGLDQFYTRPELAAAYIAGLLSRWPDPGVLFIEPSAGDGAFVGPLLDAGRKVRAIDIDPRSPGIARGDFLDDDSVFGGTHPAVVVVGNPPFGRNASLAVRFFNRAARHADEIAFIVPRTFRKASVQRRLHRRFHLTSDSQVGKNAFLRHGRPHDVPCAWQVWTRLGEERAIPDPPRVDHLIRYTTQREAQFAVRRVGFYAGRVVTGNLDSLSPSTHYFLRARADGVVETIRGIDWTGLAGQTAGARSLAKSEIAFKLNEAFRTAGRV